MSDHLTELRCALQDYVPNDPTEDNGVLTGYVVVAQWSTGDGNEWLTHTAGNINDEVPALWTLKGWLKHALDRSDDTFPTTLEGEAEDDDAS